MENYRKFAKYLVLSSLGWFILSPIIIYALFSAISDGVRIYNMDGSINPVLCFYFFGLEQTQTQINEYGLHFFLWNYVDNVYVAFVKAIIMGAFITIIIFYLDKLRNIVFANINAGIVFLISLLTDFSVLILAGIIIEYATIYLIKEEIYRYDMDYANLWFSFLCWGFIGAFIRVGSIGEAINKGVVQPIRSSSELIVDRIVVKSISLAKRCEICHQSDMFDPKNGGKCYRCSDINLQLLNRIE